MWDGQLLHKLHTYPLAKHLALIRTMPDDPRTWPPFHIPASMASSERLDTFLDLVYGELDADQWECDDEVTVSDMLGVLQLCSYFQYDELEEQCESMIASRLQQVTDVTELVAVWQFLAGVKNDSLRTLAHTATVRCFGNSYSAAKENMAAAGVWDSMGRNDLECMLELALERMSDLKKESSDRRMTAPKLLTK